MPSTCGGRRKSVRQEVESKWFGSRLTKSVNSSDSHLECSGGKCGTDGNRTISVFVHEPKRPRVGTKGSSKSLDNTCERTYDPHAEFQE
jgi:hypothetical protein